MIAQSTFFLVLTISFSKADWNIDFGQIDKASVDLENKDDFTTPTETEMAHLAIAADKHIPFEVEDKLYQGKPITCEVDERYRYDNVPFNRKKYYDFTAAQKDCHKQHKAKMKVADYGDYSYCIVDNFNRMAKSREYMTLTPDNKTIISQPIWGINKLSGIIMRHDHKPWCHPYCAAKFREYLQTTTVQTPKKSVKSYITGPAINVLRQFRRCLGLSRLGDKYKWPAPK
ncbi:hypothetical protein HDE_07575 [Halotydeus destructor]|nr:hypothetical protein HDE_07575 [Halotydeus destructor]